MLLQVVKNIITRVCRKRVFSFVRCVELKRRQQRQGVKVVFLSPRHQLVVWFLPGSILTPSHRAFYVLLSWFLFRKKICCCRYHVSCCIINTRFASKM